MRAFGGCSFGAFLWLLISLDALGGELTSSPAKPAPEWLEHGVIYQIWLRSFTSEGTLKAAMARLPRVADLGATIVYLPPIQLADADMRPEFWSKRQKESGTNNPRNPYRIADYNRIDPEYGTEEDLRGFVGAAHGLGLRVLMDLVYFHCGPTSVLMDKDGFIQRDAAGKATTGSWNFPRLNFGSAGLREYLWANMAHWVKDFGVDGFRCDVSDQVPLDFWEEARVRLQPLRPDLVILAEGQRKEDQLKAFELNYSFSWLGAVHGVFMRGEPASSLRALWEKMASARPRGTRFIRYTENHDIVNDMQRAEVVCGERGAAAIAIMNFTLDGVPFLYNGQEIGDTSPQSIYARWPVGWAAACLPKPQAKYAFHQRLCRLRRDEIALSQGEVVWLNNDQPETVVSFLRRSPDAEIVTVASLSGRRMGARVILPEAREAGFQPLLADMAKAEATADGLSIELGPFGYFVGKRSAK